MVFLFAVAVIVGALAVITWIAWQAWSEAPSSARPGPDHRFGRRGREVVAAILGFGLGGMSASYAGWHPIAAFFAALVGAAALAVSARFLSDEPA